MKTSVYFDLDGTLLNYSTPFSELFVQTLPTDATEEMIETYSEQVLTSITQVEDEPYQRAFDAVCEQYDLDLDTERLAAEYIEKEASSTHIPHTVRQLVASIAVRHQTGILTNGDGRMQRRKIEEHGLDEFVDTVIVSNEIGTRKPNREIFEAAKERLPAEVFVYIGDTFEEDITPAREAGFETVYVGEEPHPDTSVASRGTEELATLLLPLIEEGSA
ncbi:putative hydrolase of the HAD superfamily [Halorubrum xinjiangense]|uniref:Putative hydrolase of the HAD superfamily n=1 Tax=Halorubrum xinjiangense TaxID=261291 RepID=A0A1G7JQN5_9EURY|nr:HAD family hydrolase [Halorubrum xinjiangense]SDF27176.1 putative hydrolase of the HAD superfamily [Halorubrum xinjiangense]